VAALLQQDKVMLAVMVFSPQLLLTVAVVAAVVRVEQEAMPVHQQVVLVAQPRVPTRVY
jgi:hypothetical protein